LLCGRDRVDASLNRGHRHRRIENENVRAEVTWWKRRRIDRYGSVDWSCVDDGARIVDADVSGLAARAAR
jgi:hypothetical protein